MIPRVILALALGALLVVATPAPSLGAGAPSVPSAADKAKARNLVDLAKRFIAQKQLIRAVESFKQAHRYWPRKEIHFNIALVYLEQGARVKAYEHLSLYWNQSTPEERSRLPAPLLRLRNEFGTLRVRASDSGMAIHVGGRRHGLGSAEVVLTPGLHEVEIFVDDQMVQRRSLQVTGGAVVVWEAEPPQPRHKVEGTTPSPTGDPSPGAATHGKGLHLGWFVGVSSLAIAAGLVVIGTGVKTMQLGKDYDEAPTRDLQKEGRTYRAVTNVMVGVCAAAVAGAAVLALFTRWSRKERPLAVTVQPGVAPGGGSVTVEFVF